LDWHTRLYLERGDKLLNRVGHGNLLIRAWSAMPEMRQARPHWPNWPPRAWCICGASNLNMECGEQ